MSDLLTPTPTPPPEIRGTERVVVLEDDPTLCALIDRLLTGLGYTVTAVVDPDIAVATCLAEPPDVLLCDVVVPRKDGRRVAEEIRSEHPDVPVLFMSGYRPGDGVLGDIDDILPKPFTRRTLGRRLRDVLDSNGPGADPSGGRARGASSGR